MKTNTKKTNTKVTPKKPVRKSEREPDTFLNGIMCFAPHENAPDFIKAELIISVDTLNEFVGENGEMTTEHKKYGTQIKATIKESKDGKFYCVVNTFVPNSK